MKLITKTSIYYLVYSIIGFVIGGFLIYHLVYRIVNKRANEDLITEKELIEEQIVSSDKIPDFSPYFGHQIVVTIYNNTVNHSDLLMDTLMMDESSGELIPFKHLIATTNKKNRSYSIEIFKPVMEVHQLAEDIVMVMFFMLLFLLLALVVFNYLISKKIWSPFYHTINQMSQYDLNSGKGLELVKTNTNEFRQLNIGLIRMANKISLHYASLKEFTENASHEIQTPLAILKAKLELLVQNDDLTKEQMQVIQPMYQVINRLSKLNQSLLLLSRIENNQFHETEEVNLNNLIDSILTNLEDLIEQKQLIIYKNFTSGTVKLDLNPTLAEILITNLVVNAIKHNLSTGRIDISIDNSGLTISNTGLPLEADPNQLFERFKKQKVPQPPLA
jgi:signal transduction histidine kinase